MTRRRAQQELDRLQDTRDDLLALIANLQRLRGHCEETQDPCLELAADAESLARKLLVRHRVLLVLTESRLTQETGKVLRLRAVPASVPDTQRA